VSAAAPAFLSESLVVAGRGAIRILQASRMCLNGMNTLLTDEFKTTGQAGRRLDRAPPMKSTHQKILLICQCFLEKIGARKRQADRLKGDCGGS